MPPDTYRTFKALGLLLCYPDEQWRGGVNELRLLFQRESLLGENDLEALDTLTGTLASSDLFELQENYVDTFDRVRSLSLHLFEHVHGESRDRGQAMVDLAERYKEQGFVLAKSELPDYLPVFLEYLSSVPKTEAIEMLSEPLHILRAIGKRLAERGSLYSAVFDSLIRIAGGVPEKAGRRYAVPAPSFEQIDKEWEEKPVDFLGAAAPQAGGCGSGCSSGCSAKSCASSAQQVERGELEGVRP